MIAANRLTRLVLLVGSACFALSYAIALAAAGLAVGTRTFRRQNA